jgi:hypothetical protein
MKKWASEPKVAFSKEEVQMIKIYMKKCSTSLVIKKIQIKAIYRDFDGDSKGILFI